MPRRPREPVGDSTTLTAWEWLALEKTFNLADGHAHGRLDAEQLTVLGDLTELFREVGDTDQEVYERQFLRQFYRLAGQSEPAHSTIQFHYSSSMSIEVAAKALRELNVRVVGLPEPTFDNIPLLLRRHGLGLQPLPGAPWAVEQPRLRALLRPLGAVFVAAPNNPTGQVPTLAEFSALLDAAVHTGTIVVVDASFRLLSGMSDWDQYSTAGQFDGLEYMFIEDTGKTWPARELKVGLCVTSGRLAPVVERVTDEVMLNVSPFSLALLTRFVESDLRRRDAGRPILAAEVVARNRTHLRAELVDTPLVSEFPDSTISVEWVHLPQHWHAPELCAWLDTRHVSVLPGGPFYWSSQAAGHQMLRIALMRDSQQFTDSVAALRKLLLNYAEHHS